MTNDPKTDYITATIGEINGGLLNKKISFYGWVHNVRNHGHLIFIDIRGCVGMIQVVLQHYNKIPLESVVTVKGILQKRTEENINSKIFNGDLEVVVEEIIVDSESAPLPFSVNNNQPINEELEFTHRYLSLRREENRKIMDVRSEVTKDTRLFFWENGFQEIETPLLTSTSPEGARDYLVIAPDHPGKVYALPQSPQIYKQLLMVSGFPAYFQISKQFRKEEGRSDRLTGDITQIDLEKSGVKQQDIIDLVWKYLVFIFKKHGIGEVNNEKRMMTYEEAMSKYASDKPDLRNPLEIKDITDLFHNTEFSIFKEGVQKGKKVKAIAMPFLKPKSFLDNVCKWAKEGFGINIAYSYFQDEWKGPIAKFMNDKFMDFKNGVFFLCDFEKKSYDFLNQLRKKLWEEDLDHNKYEFCFITDFPMFEYDDKTNTYEFGHNPFSCPQTESLNKPIDQIKSWQYDAVCNGYELGSGSQRNTDINLLINMFEKTGQTAEYVKEIFRSMYNGFQYGVPAHAGMGIGLDRIIMLLTGTNNVRKVVAFPLNQSAGDFLTGAPHDLSKKQKEELRPWIKKLV